MLGGPLCPWEIDGELGIVGVAACSDPKDIPR